MKLAIADPPYLGRSVRWYGEGGCGNGNGEGQADNHPEAYLWDLPETHVDLLKRLERDYDGFAIAMSVHSLSTYLSAIETDSRNGIRVAVWNKPTSVPSGNRVANSWEPVLFKIPKERRGHNSGVRISDVLTCPPPRSGFVGAKPEAWTNWVLDILGYRSGDIVEDLFTGSGAVALALDRLEGFEYVN